MLTFNLYFSTHTLNKMIPSFRLQMPQQLLKRNIQKLITWKTRQVLPQFSL